MQPEIPQPAELLKSRFRLETFRKGQREVIESILSGKDAMAVMPTGGGKSLCFQIPALCREGIVVVVSPLIALMEDQVRSLKKLGVPAGCIHSGQTWEGKKELFAQLRREKHFILYLSPERVQKGGFSNWIQTQTISLFAVDESHCVSQWGPDFRKDYYRLTLLRQLKPDVPILALTATATPTVLKDIIRQLQLREPARHIYGFYRPNLYSQVEACENDGFKLAMVRNALSRTLEGRVLIYCGTSKQSVEMLRALAEDFPDMGFYHAGLGAEERAEIQKKYDDGTIRILAATNAFGMGIDHSNVRLVIHFQMPANIESYYQEMGRAGRDGEPSTCLLLYSKKDKGLHSYFITRSEADKESAKRRWRALDTIVQFAEGGECRHAGILTYFRDTFRLKACGHCDVCDPKGTRRVAAPPYSAFTPKTKVRKKAAKTPNSVALSDAETLRFTLLRQWRKEYAEANDIPAFFVFSNKTLEDLARKNPQTLDALASVYGFGPHKVEHLGEVILSKLSV